MRLIVNTLMFSSWNVLVDFFYIMVVLYRKSFGSLKPVGNILWGPWMSEARIYDHQSNSCFFPSGWQSWTNCLHPAWTSSLPLYVLSWCLFLFLLTPLGCFCQPRVKYTIICIMDYILKQSIFTESVHKDLNKSVGEPSCASTVDLMLGQPRALADLLELHIKVCETVAVR